MKVITDNKNVILYLLEDGGSVVHDGDLLRLGDPEELIIQLDEGVEVVDYDGVSVPTKVWPNLYCYNGSEFTLNQDHSIVKAEREKRDALLEKTDWWCLSDQIPTQAQLDYRQALRDITDHAN